MAMQAPARYGWDLWDYNWGLLAFALVTNVTITGMQAKGVPKGKISRSQDVANAFRSVLSIGHIVLASLQQHAEYQKEARLETVPASTWSSQT
ncbi:MAG: hypothetical protein AB7N91_22925 [Candidatus Tectimicrobiota bacterium]